MKYIKKPQMYFALFQLRFLLKMYMYMLEEY